MTRGARFACEPVKTAGGQGKCEGRTSTIHSILPAFPRSAVIVGQGKSPALT
jgi:hypothetical protein